MAGGPEKKEVNKMNVQFTFPDKSGHTELTVTDDQAVLEWKETGEQERTKLHAMVSDARSRGFEIFDATASGEAKGDKLEKLETDHFNRKGSLVMKKTTPDNGLASISFLNGLISVECKSGKIVMEQDDDGEWKYTNAKEFKIRERAQKLQSTSVSKGG